MKPLFSYLFIICVVLAQLAAARPPRSINEQQFLGQVETMSESQQKEDSSVPGHNNFTYGPVPEKNQLFQLDFLEVSPSPMTTDRFVFILLRGRLLKPKETPVEITDNLANATASLTVSAILESGKHEDPITYTAPFRTTPLALGGHISIHEMGGSEVDYLTYDTLHDILVYYQAPSMFVKTGMYTFEIVTRLEDGTCIFAYSVTQWLKGDMREPEINAMGHRNLDMMPSATPTTRASGWNVRLTIGSEQDPRAFAGIYQAAGSNLVTFRDVCNELRLCFEFPKNNTSGEGSSNDGDDPWASISFALADRPDLSSEVRGLSFINGKLLDQPVPSLPTTHPKQQNVIEYHIVSHKTCDLPSSEPLDSHLKNGCAQHLPSPARRCDPRYLPPKKPFDPIITAKAPLRQKIKASPKRSRSGSSSPSEEDDDNYSEVNDMPVPRSIGIDKDTARNSFSAACLTKATYCAVSHQGEFPINTSIQVCHIVPQMQCHISPIGKNSAEVTTIEATSRSPKEAWENTWGAHNGILLRKDLHEHFHARLFSIHPKTSCIRVFVPCDTLIQFNGKTALVHPDTDRKALQHHYDMCCIENMAALRPNIDNTSPKSGIATRTLHIPGPSLPPTPDSKVRRAGDPYKRQRPVTPTPSQPRNASRQGSLVEEVEAEASPSKKEEGYKRRRLTKYQVVDSQTSPQFHRFLKDKNMREGYITPWNSDEFLAGVNKELPTFGTRQRARRLLWQ
ncbi:hypothetical protein O1611_g5043 [Lasiodiplodia mahajangana]|uniref:Uncharacterized protein n=1 Tax=Lasiodiplodia mahajangana TaxID=1108764 RepID=A0ACC2JMA2_9PEZI|nr:hypothetical protein O1611_g5043 [Lasiodiplodia mahajangana]